MSFRTRVADLERQLAPRETVEKPEIVAARSQRFATLKALLTAPQLGIS
jgi:hypothetical protein